MKFSLDSCSTRTQGTSWPGIRSLHCSTRCLSTSTQSSLAFISSLCSRRRCKHSPRSCLQSWSATLLSNSSSLSEQTLPKWPWQRKMKTNYWIKAKQASTNWRLRIRFAKKWTTIKIVRMLQEVMRKVSRIVSREIRSCLWMHELKIYKRKRNARFN